jgi:hypothetical protein
MLLGVKSDNYVETVVFNMVPHLEAVFERRRRRCGRADGADLREG